MKEQFLIRRMDESEVQIALDWAQKEGWNPGLRDAKCFYQADPQGFFVGLLNGEPIAVGSAVVYGDDYAFCGLYIVKSEFRGHGYGLQLTHERLKYVGNRITGLDGVLDKVSKYERLGYVKVHKNVRYMLDQELKFPTHSQVMDLNTIPFSQVEEYDRKYFPAPRTAFLRCWIKEEGHAALGYLEDGKLMGYGVIRRCFNGNKIGPLFAESPKIAQTLFEALCSKVTKGPYFMDVPEPNQNVQQLVEYYKMTARFEVIRMYRNGVPDVDLGGIYAITTYELG